MESILAAAAFFAASTAIYGQAAPSAAQSRVIGEVTALNSASLTVKQDQGNSVSITTNEKTLYLRVPPGEKDLKKAARISASDIAPGDRVLARGKLSEDAKTLNAASVIVMTKADLAKKHEADRAEWQKRGVSGTISSIDPDRKEIVVGMRTREGAKPIVVEAANAQFRRYAPDSVRFADAKPSAFAELKPGDQVRILGNRNDDDTRLTAEEIVSGSFRNIAGTIDSIDAANRDIRITDLESKRKLTVKVNPDSTLRRLPPMVAQMLARRNQPGAATPAAASPQTPAPHGPPGAGPGTRGGGDVQQMLERMPPLELSELKPGDAIIISSTTGADPAKVTAITLLAGVEPLLTAAPSGGRQLTGGWNFDINMPMQ